MRRFVLILGILGVIAVAVPASGASQGIRGPATLVAAGWQCVNIVDPERPDTTPGVHCWPPGTGGIFAPGSPTVVFLVFQTTDPTATDAPFNGTARGIRADLFQGQPCPTDPPTYEYTLIPLGPGYYFCHTYDSPL
jgi:hypothetical protein